MTNGRQAMTNGRLAMTGGWVGFDARYSATTSDSPA